MKADLYTAQASTAGSGGLAHRTAAGFVVLTSADGDEMIGLIDAQQNETDLIDQVVARAQTSGPDAFAMLFTAGGELYLIASGSATASVITATGQFSMGATNDHVLVYAMSAGMGESTASISLHLQGTANADADGDSHADFRDATVAANSVQVSIGSAEVRTLTADMPKYQTTAAASGEAAAKAGAMAAVLADEAPGAEPAAEPDSAPQAHVLEGGAADVQEPEVEPVAILPATNEASLPGDSGDVGAPAEPPIDSEPAAISDPAALREPAPIPDPPMPVAAEPAPTPAPAPIPDPPMPPVPAAAEPLTHAPYPEPPTPEPAASSEPAMPAAYPEPPTPEPVDSAASSMAAAYPEPPTPADPPSSSAAAYPEPPTPAEPVLEPAATPDSPTPAPVEEASEPTPAPVAEPAAAAAEPEAEPVAAKAASSVGPVMVLGVACSQHHHNHPDAVYCSQCGTKMGVHHTTVLINGPRPPLGVLVVDDGTTYSLSQDLVIGREPTTHDDVLAGTASPMILTDDTLSLSRKHARIVLDDWTVMVQDLGSSNGTYLSRAGTAENWTRIPHSSTNALEPGDRLRVGGRIIQVELHHVR